MLTIEEIKRELDAGNTVELECVDRDGFIENDGNLFAETNRKLLKQDLKVTSVGVDSVEILGADTHIHYDEVKCFRIKRPAPTFDDLIDVAVQGVKSNVIFMDSFCVDNVRFESVVLVEDERTFDIYLGDSSDVIADAIKYIKSLYTETFVIESEEGIEKIKNGSKAILTNGQELLCKSGNLLIYRDENDRTVKMSFCTLKGATVTQTMRGK